MFLFSCCFCTQYSMNGIICFDWMTLYNSLKNIIQFITLWNCQWRRILVSIVLKMPMAMFSVFKIKRERKAKLSSEQHWNEIYTMINLFMTHHMHKLSSKYCVAYLAYEKLFHLIYFFEILLHAFYFSYQSISVRNHQLDQAPKWKEKRRVFNANTNCVYTVMYWMPIMPGMLNLTLAF